jgi:hypothetical protein
LCVWFDNGILANPFYGVANERSPHFMMAKFLFSQTAKWVDVPIYILFESCSPHLPRGMCLFIYNTHPHPHAPFSYFGSEGWLVWKSGLGPKTIVNYMSRNFYRLIQKYCLDEL